VYPHHISSSLAALIAATDLSESSQEDSDTESDTSEDRRPLVEYRYINTPEPTTRNSCYDPTFPGHSPCTTHEQRAYGKSAIAAIKLLRRRFEAEHDATGDGAWYREWIVAKGESGIPAGALMHGGSMLRCEIMYEDDEELENEEHYDESGFLFELDESDLESEEEVVLVSRCCCEFWMPFTDFVLQESSNPFDYTVGVYVPLIEEATESLNGDFTYPVCEKDDLSIKVHNVNTSFMHNANPTQEINDKLHYGDTHWSQISTPISATRTIHIRNASMNDVWGDLSSVRTSIFSKQSMVTTKSSRTSVTASHLDHSNLIEALDLSVRQHKSQDGFASLNGLLATEFSRPRSAGDNTLSAHERCRSASLTREVSVIFLRSRVRDDEGSLCALGTWMVADEPEYIAARTNHPLESTVSATDAISPTASAGRPTHFVEHLDDTDSEADYNPTPVDEQSTNRPSRRAKWLGKMKREVEKVLGQVQAAVKSTKLFTRTLAGFVPAAFSAKNPFFGIEGFRSV
jgi:hypothetical protein